VSYALKLARQSKVFGQKRTFEMSKSCALFEFRALFGHRHNRGTLIQCFLCSAPSGQSARDMNLTRDKSATQIDVLCNFCGKVQKVRATFLRCSVLLHRKKCCTFCKKCTFCTLCATPVATDVVGFDQKVLVLFAQKCAKYNWR